jgi:hypothetical protein
VANGSLGRPAAATLEGVLLAAGGDTVAVDVDGGSDLWDGPLCPLSTS